MTKPFKSRTYMIAADHDPSTSKKLEAVKRLLDDYREDVTANIFNSIRSYIIDPTLSPITLAGQWFDADPDAHPQWAEHALIDLSDALDLTKAIMDRDREALTDLCLHFSLCPMHRIDYAICFDDEDPECSQIRAIHPAHDT